MIHRLLTGSAFALVAAAVTLPVSALQVESVEYDYWLQQNALDKTGVVRLDRLITNPQRVEPDGADPFYTTSGVTSSSGFQTATFIDPEFVITSAATLLDYGEMTIQIGTEVYTSTDWWMPSSAFANTTQAGNNLTIIRLDRPVTDPNIQIYDIYRGDSPLDADTNIVSFGSLNGLDGSRPAGIRREVTNKLDVTFLPQLSESGEILALDLDLDAGLIEQAIETWNEENPFDQFNWQRDGARILEGSATADDSGAVAFVDGLIAGISGASFTVNSPQLNQTVSLFTDVSEYADDIDFLLDRSNWIFDDAFRLVPTTPGGWERARLGFSMNYVRAEKRADPTRMRLDDTDFFPFAIPAPATLVADGELDLSLLTDLSAVSDSTAIDEIAEYTIFVLAQIAASGVYPNATLSEQAGNLGIFHDASSSDYTDLPAGAPGSIGPITPGDLDLDGDVDSDDLSILLANWETDQSAFVASNVFEEMPLFKGDIDGTLFIDISDLTILLTYWTGQLTQSDIQAIEAATGLNVVPEPATLALLSLGGLTLLRRRR